MAEPAPGGPFLVHATCVALGKAGVLILGPSGSGKSELALRLIDHPDARLVADDQVVIARLGDSLVASPPKQLEGMLEVRGMGIIELPFAEQAVLALAVRLRPASEIERMPESDEERYEAHGIALPTVQIDPARASASARVRVALYSLGVQKAMSGR